jgi:hypothetical protein
MSKRAKRGKAETLALPMVGRVAIGAVAVAALGYSLLSRPTNVQPIRKPSAHQALSSSTPVYESTPVHASASAPAPISVEAPKAADVPGAFVRQVVDYASHQMPGTVIIDTGRSGCSASQSKGPSLRVRFSGRPGARSRKWSAEFGI